MALYLRVLFLIVFVIACGGAFYQSASRHNQIPEGCTRPVFHWLRQSDPHRLDVQSPFIRQGQRLKNNMIELAEKFSPRDLDQQELYRVLVWHHFISFVEQCSEIFKSVNNQCPSVAPNFANRDLPVFAYIFQNLFLMNHPRVSVENAACGDLVGI